MATVVAQAQAEPRRKTGKLGLAACIALVVGNVIGSGVYLLPSSLAPFGGLALVGWVFTSAGALLVALVFARLAQLIPKAGGPYAYSRSAFSEFAGFLIAWGYWIGIWSSVAAVAVAMVSYLAGLIPALGTNPIAAGAVAIGVVWLLTGVNLRGVHGAGVMQTVTTIIKLIPLIAVGTIGLLWTNWGTFPDRPARICLTHLGRRRGCLVDLVCVPRHRIGHGARRGCGRSGADDSPCYCDWHVGLCGRVYPEHHRRDGRAAAQPIGGVTRALCRCRAGHVGKLGLSSCRYRRCHLVLWRDQRVYSFARPSADGGGAGSAFPGALRQVSKNGVPAFGCIVSSVLVTILLAINYAGQAAGSSDVIGIYNSIILLATFVTLVPYALCAMADLMLFVTDRPRFNGQRMGLSIVVAILAFIFSLILIYGAGAETALLGFLMLLLACRSTCGCFASVQQAHPNQQGGIHCAIMHRGRATSKPTDRSENSLTTPAIAQIVAGAGAAHHHSSALADGSPDLARALASADSLAAQGRR